MSRCRHCGMTECCGASPLLNATTELLVALKNIILYTNKYPQKSNQPYFGGSFLSEELFDQAEKAIAKAEGKKSV